MENKPLVSVNKIFYKVEDFVFKTIESVFSLHYKSGDTCSQMIILVIKAQV